MEAQADEKFWAHETTYVNDRAAIGVRTRVRHFDVPDFAMMTGNPGRRKRRVPVRHHIKAPVKVERTLMSYQACGAEDQRSRAGMVEAGDS